MSRIVDAFLVLTMLLVLPIAAWQEWRGSLRCAFQGYHPWEGVPPGVVVCQSCGRREVWA